MIRKIIKIDKEKCNGCGACATACHEGAIGMVEGKAELLRDDYCDGLGDCLPACPTGAITFEERDAAPYDKKAVEAKMAERSQQGCPGSRSRMVSHTPILEDTTGEKQKSQLSQWPVQIQLVPVQADYFYDAKLLVAADCTAFAYGSFHKEFIAGHVTLIGCPKLDKVDYTKKLTEIIRLNEIKSITVARMEVPCCGGIEHAVKEAIVNSGKSLPLQICTISIQGEIL